MFLFVWTLFVIFAEFYHVKEGEELIRVAIVEDNIGDLNRLKSFLDKFCLEENIECDLSCFKNGMEFLDNMNGEYDVIVLDIEMPMFDGMSTAKRIREMGSTSNILFVTNMAQYALQGYEVEARGYMVKPITYFNFAKVFKKITKIISMNSHTQREIIINTKQGINIIKLTSLKYVEVVGHSLIFHTENGDVRCVRKTLKDLEAELNCAKFARCSSCYLVNFDYINTISGNTVTLFDDTVLFLSRGKKQEFIRKIMDYTN